jgi:Protein of unknown function (DUF1647)
MAHAPIDLVFPGYLIGRGALPWRNRLWQSISMPTRNANEKPIIITGADQAYWRSLWQFLRSAERMHVDQRFMWLVYDLGLKLDTRDRLSREFPWISMRDFDFANYPPHVAMASRSLAWKPIIIADVLDEANAPVFWLDSATIVTSDLSEPVELVRRHGVFSLKGKPPLGEHCDPRVLEALDVPQELLHLPERVGGFVGFDPSHPVARDIAQNWARHALIESHIMPPNSMPDHKAEQATLSALLYKAEAQGLLTLTDHEVDISSGRPMRWVTTRNKVGPHVPRWADGAVRAYYHMWKASDQFLHRLKDWEKRRVGGVERRYREHYEVSVQLANQPPVTIPSPSGGFYADPFPLRHDGQNYVLVEEYPYHEARGRLTCLSLDKNLQVTAADPIVPLDCHASYPFVLEFAGKAYLVPETHEARAIDLYVAGDTPRDWTLRRRLLYGINAADTVVFHRGEYWWLLTSVQEEGKPNRHLEIYFAKDLLRDDFTPHPVNAERRYQNDRHGTGRNAGSYLRTPRGMVRPMQSSADHYGQGLRLMLITKLDPEQFEESPCDFQTPYSDVVDMLSPHHVAQNGELLVWDVRDRAR